LAMLILTLCVSLAVSQQLPVRKLNPIKTQNSSSSDDTPWIAHEFHQPVFINQVVVHFSGAHYTYYYQIRLTNELPTTENQMYTGGIAGTGHDKFAYNKKVEFPTRSGKYVLVQKNRASLRVDKVQTFGPTECDELEVVKANFTSDDNTVHNLFTPDEKEWRAVESFTQDQGFLLKISEGDRNVTGVGIQNAEQPWATKKFRVSGGLQDSGPWINPLEDELKVDTTIQTFNFSRPWLVRYLKFDLITYAGQRGGGLRFFTILADSRTLPPPQVIWSDSLNPSHSVEQILARNNWLTTTGYTGHAFTIQVSGCKTNLAGIRIKNTVNGEYKNRATKNFSVSVAKEDEKGWHWVKVLSGHFENPLLDGAPTPELEMFLFEEIVQVQFLKFQVESYWGDFGGGLDHFEVITLSDLCKLSLAGNCVCGTSGKPLNIDCSCTRECAGNGGQTSASLSFKTTSAIVLGALIWAR